MSGKVITDKMQFTLQGFPSGPRTIPEGNLVVFGVSNVVAIEFAKRIEFREGNRRN